MYICISLCQVQLIHCGKNNFFFSANNRVFLIGLVVNVLSKNYKCFNSEKPRAVIGIALNKY